MWGFVLAIVTRTLGSESPEDTAQEVFVRVARYCPFPRLQTGDAFRAYLWKVAKNECYTWLRRNRRAVPIAEQLNEGSPLESCDDPGADFEWRELYEWATEELDGVDREILRLTDEGFSGDEIAKHLGLSSGNVAVRRHRARDIVRKFLRMNNLSS
jgi:RNA polymerase sigma factor (sigma-70 family)